MIKGNYYLLKDLIKSQSTGAVLRYCSQTCYALFTQSQVYIVQLCSKYHVDVALCSSGASRILLQFVVILVRLSFHTKSVCLSSV